jgi:hypothetical protein
LSIAGWYAYNVACIHSPWVSMRQTHAPEALQDNITLLDSDDAVVFGSDARRDPCPCHRDCRISRGVEELGDETAFCREIFSLHSYDLLRQLSLGSGILLKQGIIDGGKYGQQPRRADQLVSWIGPLPAACGWITLV